MSETPNIKFCRVTPDTEPTLQAVFERSPEYFRRVEGSEVLPHFAKKELESIPSKLSPSYEKVYLLVSLNDIPIGAVDFHKDHPSAGEGYIGLLLLDESYHGKGLGRGVYEALEKYVEDAFDIKHLLLGVSEKNNVTEFWRKMGFIENGKIYVWKGEKIETTVHEMEKMMCRQL